MQPPHVQLPAEGYHAGLISRQMACPVRTDARGYVGTIAEGRLEEAHLIAPGPNPFASIRRRICGAPSEAECRRGKAPRLDADGHFVASARPVAIRALQRFACEAAVCLADIASATHSPVPTDTGRPQRPGRCCGYSPQTTRAAMNPSKQAKEQPGNPRLRSVQVRLVDVVGRGDSASPHPSGIYRFGADGRSNPTNFWICADTALRVW